MLPSEIWLKLFAYLIFINTVGFCLFAWDKKRAKQGDWRIREKDLLFCAIIGGSLGGLLAMYTFHHKTRHLKFQVGMPLLLLLQGVLLNYVIKQ